MGVGLLSSRQTQHRKYSAWQNERLLDAGNSTHAKAYKSKSMVGLMLLVKKMGEWNLLVSHLKSTYTSQTA